LSLTKHQRAGAKAIDQAFRESLEPTILLYRLSVIAGQAAVAAGRKRHELFTNLYEYDCLLPAGSYACWQAQGSGEVYVTTNPYHLGPQPHLTVSMRHPGAFDVATDAHISHRSRS
jgi:hypothetical protein